MPPTAREYVEELLQQAECCIGWRLDPAIAPEARTQHVQWFIYHVTTAVLLEHLRRRDPATADQLVPWLLMDGGIFSDGYADELVYEWREQLAAGQEMAPIGLPADEWPVRSLIGVDVVDTEAVQQALRDASKTERPHGQTPPAT